MAIISARVQKEIIKKSTIQPNISLSLHSSNASVCLPNINLNKYPEGSKLGINLSSLGRNAVTLKQSYRFASQSRRGKSIHFRDRDISNRYCSQDHDEKIKAENDSEGNDGEYEIVKTIPKLDPLLIEKWINKTLETIERSVLPTQVINDKSILPLVKFGIDREKLYVTPYD